MEHINLINQANTLKELEDIRVKLLGKKGLITQKLKELSSLAIEEKKSQGQKLNVLKNEIAQLITQKKDIIENCDQTINEIDYTIPSKQNIGYKHVLTESINLLHEIFANMGFEFATGPDIEDIYYNFEALNIAKDHPSRDDHDTFYMSEKEKLLRTQVTSVQVRLLEKLKGKDTRAYSIGRVYRNDSHDATHTCMFHQIEGIIIEENVTMQHLKGFLEYVFEKFFERKVKIRFRPSYFPFTEPSCEIDIFTQRKNGKLEVCATGNPLEIAGCGIIHPTILQKFNQEGKQAFAFGVGLERMIMLKYGIANIHTLYNNHIKHLKYETQ